MSDEDTQLMSFLRKTEFHTTDEHLPGWNISSKLKEPLNCATKVSFASLRTIRSICCLSRNNDNEQSKLFIIPAKHKPRSK